MQRWQRETCCQPYGDTYVSCVARDADTNQLGREKLAWFGDLASFGKFALDDSSSMARKQAAMSRSRWLLGLILLPACAAYVVPSQQQGVRPRQRSSAVRGNTPRREILRSTDGRDRNPGDGLPALLP